MAKSPSVTIREVDRSSYAVTNSATVPAIVGYGTKGPIGEAQTITSRNEFIQNFGPLPEQSPWGHLAAYRAFNQTNQIIYYRVAEEEGSNAAVAAERGITNAHPAIAGYQNFSQTDPVAYGSYTLNQVYDFKVTVDNEPTSERNVFIPSPTNGDWTLDNIASSINTQITSDVSGFQEFSKITNPSISEMHRDYRFKVDVDGTSVASGEDLSVILNPGASLTDIATGISSVMATGSRGYHRYNFSTDTALGDTTSLATGIDYSFNVSVDGAAAVDVTITATTDMTYFDLISAINTDMDNNSIAAYTYFDINGNGSIRVQSETEGAASTIILVDNDTATTSNALFNTLDSSGTLETANDGVDSTLVEDTDYSVSVNSDTGRIRVVSGTTGEDSTINLTSPTIGLSILTLLDGALGANDGEAAVSASATIVNGKVRITSDLISNSSAIGVVASTDGGADNSDLVALIGTEATVGGEDAVFESASDNILFTASEKGSATNDISIVKLSRTSPIDDSIIHTVEVYYGDILQETFDDVSLTETDDNFFVTAMNQDSQNGGSEWVGVDYEDHEDSGIITFADGIYLLGTSQNDTDSEYTDGDEIGEYNYRVGSDGIPSSGGAALFTAALATSEDLGNSEAYDFHILTTPDNGSEATQNAAIQLAQYRKDFIYIADPPYGLEYNEVADWHNGKGSHGRNAAINNSYAATYWPWLKTFDSTLGEYIWSPPSVFIGEKYIEVDNRFAPWYAPAGDIRGRIVASDIETSPSQAKRDILYGDLNAVNPIVEFNSKGIEIYGQKTLYRANSAVNRINVRRTLIYIKKLVKTTMEGLVFEPHTPDSWNRATNLISAILEPIRQGGGLEDYQVQIDGNINTEDLISQGIMKGIITVVPVGTIERVELSLKFLNPGASIEEG